jgi:hypothetical protein
VATLVNYSGKVKEIHSLLCHNEQIFQMMQKFIMSPNLDLARHSCSLLHNLFSDAAAHRYMRENDIIKRLVNVIILSVKAPNSNITKLQVVVISLLKKMFIAYPDDKAVFLSVSASELLLSSEVRVSYTQSKEGEPPGACGVQSALIILHRAKDRELTFQILLTLREVIFKNSDARIKVGKIIVHSLTNFLSRKVPNRLNSIGLVADEKVHIVYCFFIVTSFCFILYPLHLITYLA